MPLTLLLILGSCGSHTPSVSPSPGVLPEQAVLYLRADTFALVDAKGGAPVISELFRHGGVTAVRVDAPSGTEFALTATAGGDPRPIRFGPYRIESVAQRDTPTPKFRYINRSWKTAAVFLGFDADFPAYELELEALEGPKEGQVETVVLLKDWTYLGYETCLDETWKWDGAVSVRVAGLSPTGKRTEFSRRITLRPPLGSQASRLDYALDFGGDRWLELLVLASALTAIVVLWRRRDL